MKTLILGLLLLFVFMGCSDPLKDNESCPCEVKLHELQEDGTYKRITYKFRLLENPRTLSGPLINVRLNPKFYMDGTTSEITPEAQYFKDAEGRIVPADTLTEELFSIYKNMEELYLFDKETQAEQLLKYPRTVSVHQRSKSRIEIDNAFYAPIFDQIVVLSYNGRKAPLGMNKGVMAHEHFHAIFNSIVRPIKRTVNDISFLSANPPFFDAPFSESRQVVQPIIVEEKPSFNFLILKSLDEGLSDFWAHLITGLSNPYLASYTSSVMGWRDITGSIIPIDPKDVLSKNLNYEDFKSEQKNRHGMVNSHIYSYGIRYSNLIKAMSEVLLEGKPLAPEEKRIVVGKWILSSLQKLAEVVDRNGKNKVLDQSEILESFIPLQDTNRNQLSKICSDVNEFLKFHDKKVSSCSSY
jgi:hypothetical protein